MIHKTKDLSDNERMVLEGLLGRSMSEDDCVSIRTKPDASAPEWLRASWDSARESGLDQLSMDEIDAEIAAVRQQRYAYAL
jgi:hypothetical protein